MIEFTAIHHLIIVVFVIGYTAIALEYYFKVNKTASATLMAVASWILLFVHQKGFSEYTLTQIDTHLGAISQIIFFLMTAMTLVELIDSHKGFNNEDVIYLIFADRFCDGDTSNNTIGDSLQM